NVGIFSEDEAVPPFKTGNSPHDLTNIAPRPGAGVSLNSRTVIRGGFGKIYGWSLEFLRQRTYLKAQFSVPGRANHCRPHLPSHPYKGAPPTYEQVLASGGRRDVVRGTWSDLTPEVRGRIPYAYTSSVGIQRQLGDTMSVQADYVYTASR